MKKAIATAVVISLLSAVGALAADKDQTHQAMHEMIMKEEGLKPDERIELKIPEPMKAMQKKMMRQHMDTIGEIAAALAAGDLARTAKVARGLGWTEEWRQECEMVEKMTGEADIMKLGKAIHLKADDLADAAKAGKRDKALLHLSELINTCNACHNKFRH